MSSSQQNQDITKKPTSNSDVSSVKRKKTRPNQRKRRQIALLKAQQQESEDLLLKEEIGKKAVPSISDLNGLITKPVVDKLSKATVKSAKSKDVVNNKEAPIKSLKKNTANKQNSDHTTGIQHPTTLPEVASNRIPTVKKIEPHTAKLKPPEKGKIINSQINSKPSKSNDIEKQSAKATLDMSENTKIINSVPGKTREEILAEREAKKLAKQAKKTKILTTDSQATLTEQTASTPPVAAATPAAPQERPSVTPITTNTVSVEKPVATGEKTREQIKAEREAKKKAKQALKEAKATGVPELAAQLEATKINENSDAPTHDEKKKPALTKAERRALQEAQRAAKAQALAQKSGAQQAKPAPNNIVKKPNQTTPSKENIEKDTLNTVALSSSPAKSVSPSKKSQRINDCKVRLFNHLEKARIDVSSFINNPHVHPSIARLGEQYAQRTVVGSNARCIAFLNALKMVIRDFETPPKKEFARSLETTITYSVEHLQKCRPLAVSVSNAYKHIKHVLTQLPTDKPETDLKDNLCRFIDTYIENQIGKAAEAISYSVQEKISNGDVILTFGCSSLITYIFEEAQRRRVNFRVIIVDSRPFCEGQELLRRLTVKEIPCSYVLINAVSFVMPDATKVLLGAHALLANGYVMARTGTAQVALVAHSFNVPVLVCCETHKFSERSQTDAIVYNELGNPDDLIRSDKCSLTNWQTKGRMVPLNLMYDITPSELVTAVVTEVSILPCTSVPVILRIKPTEIGY